MTDHRDTAAYPPTYFPPFLPCQILRDTGPALPSTEFHTLLPTSSCCSFKDMQSSGSPSVEGYSLTGPLLGHMTQLRGINSAAFALFTVRSSLVPDVVFPIPESPYFLPNNLWIHLTNAFGKAGMGLFLIMYFIYHTTRTFN